MNSAVFVAAAAVFPTTVSVDTAVVTDSLEYLIAVVAAELEVVKV